MSIVLIDDVQPGGAFKLVDVADLTPDVDTDGHVATGDGAGNVGMEAASAHGVHMPASPLAVGSGGTGATTLADSGVLIGNAANAVEALAIPANEGDATHADRFLRGDATAATSPSWKGIEQKVGITIEDPVTADNITIIHFQEAATIQEVHAICIGGTSVAYNLYMNATRTTETTKAFTADVTVSAGATATRSVPDTAAIAAEDFLFIDLSTVSGTPTEFHVTVRYTTT